MRIAVIGAGIGGLIAAVGLQGDGHDVTVFERRASPGAIGAGLTLFPNSFSALDAIGHGLGDLARDVSSEVRVTSGQRRPTGRWLLKIAADDAPEVRTLHRAELYQALSKLLPDGSIHASASTAVSDLNSYDLIIAADGVHSDARKAWGLDKGVRFAGYTAWRGVTAMRADVAGETWGRGARFGIVPLPGDRTYWFATLRTDPGVTFADNHESLREVFGRWHRPVPDLIEATLPDDILHHDIYDLTGLPDSFVVPGGVLIGDAAHAMTPDLGQGAGQAIEDSAALVLLLRESGRDEALRRFDEIRRPRVTGMWKNSRMMGRIAQAHGPITSGLRDTTLALTPSALAARSAKAKSSRPFSL